MIGYRSELQKQEGYVDSSSENDSFYCRPTQKNVITKLAFATEEIYRRSQHSARTGSLVR